MFSHLSLKPSSSNGQSSPSLLEDIGEKLSGSRGKLLEGMMAKSTLGDEPTPKEPTSSNGVPARRNRDALPFGKPPGYGPSDKEYGHIRAFDPVTNIGMIWFHGKGLVKTIPFDTKCISTDLLAALKAGERGMDVVFKARSNCEGWMATEIEEDVRSQAPVC